MRRVRLCTAAGLIVHAVLVHCASAQLTTARAAPERATRNVFGAHLLIDQADERGMMQLRWARHLVGRWGHVKTIFGEISNETNGPEPRWREFLAACYQLELVPLVRLAGKHDPVANCWVRPMEDAPGDYQSIAQAIRRVVEGLPRDDRCPLYIEIWNEPNVAREWGGRADPGEYARFFVQAAKAIHSIGDPRVRVLNGAVALDGVQFTEAMCKAVPEFVQAFDVWASHPYPMNRPPEINLHDGTATGSPELTIDGYLVELDVLRRYGRRDVRVMITETGYDLGNDLFARREGHPIINEANRADYFARAFRDYWTRWPEVEAVFPFVLAGCGWDRLEWVCDGSGIGPDGRPSKARPHYLAVASLAKPGDCHGAISGKVTLERGLPVAQVRVECADRRVETDDAGCFYLPRLGAGVYELLFERVGFEPARRRARVEAATNTVVDVTLRATGVGILSGRIRDGLTGKPLDGVTLNFRPAPPGPIATGPGGVFDAIPLRPIAYSLSLSKPGYQTVTLPGIAVPVGERRSLTVPLGPDRDPIWPNLLGNPSFEEGGGGGGQAGVALRFEPAAMGPCFVAEDIVRSGRRSQAIEADRYPITLRQITHYNTVRAGERYVAGAWVRVLELAGGGASISLDFTENDGRIIQRTPAWELLRGTSDGWRHLEVGDVAPAGAKRVAVNLNVGAGSGLAWFDDVYLGVVPWE